MPRAPGGEKRKSRPWSAANRSTRRVPLHNFLLCGLCWTVNLLFIAAVILKSWYINFVKERENVAAELIKRALPENLRGRFTLIDATDEPVARVALYEGSLDFIPIWAGEGFPKDVEAALAVNARAVAQRTRRGSSTAGAPAVQMGGIHRSTCRVPAGWANPGSRQPSRIE